MAKRYLKLEIIEADEPAKGVYHCNLCRRQLFHAPWSKTLQSFLLAPNCVLVLCEECVAKTLLVD